MSLAQIDLKEEMIADEVVGRKYIDGQFLTKDQTIIQFTPLVKRIAKYFWGQGKRTGLDFDDLVQSGFEGLVTAFDHYNEEQGNKFITFAHKIIFSRIFNSITRFSGALSFSQEVKTIGFKIKRMDLTEKDPTYISKRLNVSEFKAEMALAFIRHEKAIRLDPFLYGDAEKHWGVIVGTTDDTSIVEVNVFLSTLKSDDRKAIKLLMDGYSYRELGRIIGKSGGYANLVKKRVLKKYKEFAH
ncbi:MULTISPECIES: sigma-70 family RNA polymerase sigma factor [Bacillus]|uniref:Sigma-70 family RNA polymerase sigma factor n=1 Tax=Bacillus glycinifermentans TaxID=1664069 RepID=A0A0T6BII7_9BACI|nr:MULTISPECIES: sigma-70 family RNA polymerase sigma factor [Bacillus]KRT87072.1 hypothetical protein AB447_208885 [Bacillus glycinifermentans]MEC0341874.1 sigma-70 family RNA polymerase sigma factor [Bacillus sonorensis]MEC0457440.1 sigma-70 family RNA polymerase sigma factor [Bacillus sonorensis]MEC0487123.1 sigma-70 family RNA polymerase sigma factor [Bacillus glycinifermentans]MEC0530765.1 sigma-70 family RNA polymerase sigma factor [Bacillus sonorensis]